MHKKNHSQKAEELIQKIKHHEANIGIVGLGYVGLPLVKAFCHKGFNTTGFDVDTQKITTLKQNKSYIRHIPASDIYELNQSGKFNPTADLSQLANMDVIILCVPTPLTKQREPDMCYIQATALEIAEFLREGQIVILESSTYPGTTRDMVKPILETKTRKSGEQFYLAYSPEREDPGNLDFETTTIPKVVGGDDKDALDIATAVYQEIIEKTVPVSSAETAEAVKLTENIFRAVNIALVNELKLIFKTMDVDVWEVIDAASTKPFGFMPFYPGPGLGGHCIPIDPFYLTWKAREYGIPTRFIELAGEINNFMPRFVVSQLTSALNSRFAKALNGTNILLVGLSYKKNVDDVRESPTFSIMEILEQKGAHVAYYDPFVPKVPATREHPQFNELKSITLSENGLKPFQAAIICTDHDDVDYQLLTKHCPLIVDTRNVLAAQGIIADNIIKA